MVDGRVQQKVQERHTGIHDDRVLGRCVLFPGFGSSPNVYADPNGFYTLLQKFPWHGDTLLQLAEVFRHREGSSLSLFLKIALYNHWIEYAQAVEYVDRALFSYERAFFGSFNFTTGLNRLDFDHIENRPFFLAVHRQTT
jgi:hypothetical protein